jgi:hypothetical protein
MEIRTNSDVPDSTYSVTGDSEPYFKDNILHIFDGHGSRRSWGTPQTTSTIVLNDSDLTSIHIGYSHKHGGSQFWRHYKNNIQTKWIKLSESNKLRIIDAYQEKAPSWANVPGKLKCQYKIYQRDIEYDNAGNIIAYKYLRLLDDGYYSIVSNYASTKWEENHLVANETPSDDNSNGIYCAKVPHADILEQYSNSGFNHCALGKYHLVKLMLCGIVLEFDYGFRAEEAYIIEVLS